MRLMLLALLVATPAVAQDAVPAEVVILLDASREMSRLPTGAEPTCGPADRRTPGVAAYVPDTALSLVKEALIGTRTVLPGSPKWCVSLGAADRALHILGPDGAEAHHRPMCCAQEAAGLCTAWAACGNDHGQAVVANDAVAPGAPAWAADGLLHADPAVRFALLTSDGEPNAEADARGHYSFGNDGLRVGGAAVDLGARGPGEHAGALVAGAGEDAVGVALANAQVAAALGRVVAHGGAPLAALLHDATRHVAERLLNDGAAHCRRRVVVLLTRGEETAFFAGQPAHYPYAPLEVEAGALLEHGVSLHVVVLGTPDSPGAQRMQQLALQRPEVQVHTAADLGDLRSALQAVVRDAHAGRRGRTPPLVVSPAPVDYCPAAGPLPCPPRADGVVQWRIHAFSDVEPGGNYGRLHAERLTCERAEGEPLPVVPRFGSTLRYETLLGGWARRTWTAGPQAVLGAANALFDTLGRSQLAVMIEQLTGIALLPQAERPDGLPVAAPAGQRAVGLRLAGYFGERGLEVGAARQLGAMELGDLAVLSPPTLGLPSPAALAWDQANLGRPTLVAAGAADGQVHLFRARDGVEVFTFVPDPAWTQLTGEAPMDGPLAMADLLACRTLEGAGDADCSADPAGWRFSAWLFGATGRGGDAVFGVPISTDLARNADRPLALPADAVGGWSVRLGGSLATSRPVVMQVREGAQVRAAVLVGCGDDPDPVRRAEPHADGPGRCVLVLEAATGRTIRRFSAADEPHADRPFSGSAVSHPGGGLAPADRAWIGDGAGRLWRLDLRSSDPTRWTLALAWPAFDVLRGPVVDRPSLAERPDGALVVVFATGAAAPGEPGEVVSLVERPRVGAEGWDVQPAWRLPLGPGEVPTSAITVRDSSAHFTTRQLQAQPGQCPEVTGRLYGVHAWRTRSAAGGQPFQAQGGRQLDVVPALPRFGGDAALAVLLPPGRTAAGLAFARTPACQPGAAATTEVVLNLADDRDGTTGFGGDAAVAQSRLEVVDQGVVRAVPLRGALFARGQGVELAVCLDCDPAGLPAPPPAAEPPPIPSQLFYWGDVFHL